MQNILKPVLLIVFSVNFFYVSAQSNSADPAKDIIGLMIDSSQRTQVSKKESAGVFIIRGSDFKEINLAKTFQEIEILGDVNLILTNGPSGKIMLKGDQFDLDHTKVKIESGKLIIRRADKTKSKLQISMSVANLSRLVIEGDAEVFSSGTIHTKGLQIILDGTSMVSVRCNGKLDVFAGTESELIDIADYRRIVSRN